MTPRSRAFLLFLLLVTLIPDANAQAIPGELSVAVRKSEAITPGRTSSPVGDGLLR